MNENDISKSRIEMLLKRTEHSIERLKPRIEKLENNKENLTVHGYRELGYFKGRLSALEDMADDLRELQNEREVKIVEAFRHIGDEVYSALFNVPGEDPRLESEKIRYIEVGADRIDLFGEEGIFIAEFDDVGKWKHDRLSSFSRSDIEEEIEKWWKKKLGIDDDGEHERKTNG